MIRRRAQKLPAGNPSEFDLTPGLTTQQFIDSVVWERAREFTGEAEGRWFDIIRLDMFDQLKYLEDPYEAEIPENILVDRYFFPIPVADIYINPSLDNR